MLRFVIDRTPSPRSSTGVGFVAQAASASSTANDAQRGDERLAECVTDGAAAYFADIRSTVASSIRLEKPHSLSYQLVTLTRRPATFVSVASNVDDAGL